METSHSFVLWRMLWTLLACLLFTCQFTYAAAGSNSTTMATGPGLVAAAQTAMAHANALILKHPRLNHYEMQSAQNKEAASKEAEPLPLGDFSNNTTGSGTGARVTRRASANNATLPSGQEAKSYTVPPEVAEAAVGASSGAVSKVGLGDSYDSVVASLQAKFKPKINDTNRMDQRTQTYSGLMGGIIPPGHGYELATTDTTDNSSTVQGRQKREDPTPSRQNRSSGGSSGDDTAFWMETIKHLGAVPGGPKDYKVWRNIKDYGAVGDGVTDDTAAIQKAMTDGGRDKEDAGVLPATVYFPSGTYIVSSPIIHLAHTEIIGNPLSLPRLKAAPSFVGLGLITSEAFVRQASAWFLDSGSQQRSARNLIIDVRAAPEDAYVAGVHWQAGRGCSLENVRFYMSQAADTTQLGLFVENGRGGSLSDLFFVGGRVGMLVGQQQFAADGLYFSNCQTAVQMVWDWGLSLQNLVVSDCGTGVDIVEAFDVSVPGVLGDNASNNSSSSSSSSNGTMVRREVGISRVVRVSKKSSSWWPYRLHRRQNDTSSTETDDGGASSPSRTGSFSLIDVRFADTKIAIAASLSSESTALLVLNAAFSNVGTSVRNSDSGAELVAGGTSAIEAWAFGKVYDRSTSSFRTVHGETLSEGVTAPPKRNTSLTISTSAGMPEPIFFHRRRPSYASIDRRATQIINVKDFGARGDGASDDTGILNKLLDMAANMSAVAYFPHGSYVISDTLDVPIGSRLVGEAWATIVAASETAFGDVENPRAAVRVGRRVPGLQGDAGVIEIQGLTFTTRGKADGAVVMEWNARQSVGLQGSAGLWDTQFRVADEKDGGSAALMLHLRRGSSAYVDNIGLGPDADGSEAVSGRGLLVESRGPSWLWGTSSGNNALYQYGFYRAENIVAGQLIMSTSTAFSSLSGMAQDLVKNAPFAADPLPDSKAALTGVRISNSDGIQVLSAGDLDSTSSVSLLDIEHSRSVSVHNANGVTGGANTTAIIASASVSSDTATIQTAVERRQAGNSTGSPDSGGDDGKISSILSMTDASTATAITFDPFALWTLEDLDGSNTTDACNTVLTSMISCPNITLAWSTQPMYHGSLGNANLTAAVCDSSCKNSINGWIVRARSACKTFVFPSGMSPMLPAYYILYGLSETCSTDSATGENCNDVIDKFDGGSTLDDMPKSELCSDCYTARLKMMQGSPYSVYRQATFYQRALKKAIATCPLDSNTPTEPQPAPIPSDPGANVCVSDKHYTSKAGDDCNSIALAGSVSSAGLLNSNKNFPSIINCTSIPVGTNLCLPLECETYSLKANETCLDVAFANGITTDDLLRYNSWIDPTCSNLDVATPIVGRVLCLSPPGGVFDPGNGTSPGGDGNGNGGGTGQNSGGTGYSTTLAAPPAGFPVAKGTTLNCGVWRVVRPSDTCDAIQLSQGLARELLLETNPSLVGSDCDAQLKPGSLYCVSPLETWDTVVSYPYNELGCYAQDTGTDGDTTPRVLWDEYTVDAAGMTVEQCADHCLLMGFPFFGLLAGDACYCGNTLTAGSSSVAAAKCDQVCVGNTTESCGGSDASNTMDVWGWPSAVVIASAS